MPGLSLRKKMVEAPVGDDVFYDDPTIIKLQDEMAKLYGKEAGLITPSGTMSNLMALMVHCTEKGDAAILGDKAHMNNWERGNIAACGSAFPVTIKNLPDGTLDHV